jgi:hypothetical protein
MKRTKDIDLVREYVEADRYEFYSKEDRIRFRIRKRRPKKR